METEKYLHHGKIVSVIRKVKGKHREHCLCFKCKEFNIEDRDSNCSIANILYSICVAFNLVTPVYECPNFIIKEKPKIIKEDECEDCWMYKVAQPSPLTEEKLKKITDKYLDEEDDYE